MSNRLFARIIRLILVVVVAYALWALVVPWLRSHGSFDRVSIPKAFEPKSSAPEANGGGSVAECLAAAGRANARVTERLRGLRDPRQAVGRWRGMSGPMHDEVASASDACSCAAAACQRASEAMSALDDLIGQFDSTFEGRAESLPDVGGGEQEVQSLLDEARKLARDEKN